MKSINNLISQAAVENFISSYGDGSITPDEAVVIKNKKIRSKESMITRTFSGWQVKTKECIKNHLSNEGLIGKVDYLNLGNRKYITARDVYLFLVQTGVLNSPEERRNMQQMQSVSLSSAEFAELSLNDGFTPNVHYNVIGDVEYVGSGDLPFPKHVTFNGHLRIVECNDLKKMSKSLKVKGSLQIRGCESLTTLPDFFQVGGRVLISDCKNLQSLGNLRLVGNGSLVVSNCQSLTSLPDKLQISKGLKLINCSNVKELPSNLLVQGDIYLSNCYGLMCLPEGFTVQKSLYIHGCRKINHFPDNLQVKGDLLIDNCHDLEDFGNGHQIDGNLTFDNNSILSELGQNTKVEGIVRLLNCKNVAISPQWVFEANYDKRNESDGTDDNYGFDNCYANCELPDWKSIKNFLSTIDKVHMHKFLKRISKAPDYQDKSTRIIIRKRLMTMFLLIKRNEELKEKVLAVITGGSEGSINSSLLALNYVDRIAAIESAKLRSMKEKNATALKEAALQVICLKEIDKIAHQYVIANPRAQEVDVILNLQLTLSKKFNLPGRTKFVDCLVASNLTDIEYKKAEARIRKVCTYKAAVDYLKNSLAWDEFLRHCEAPPFESLGVEYVQNIDECSLMKVMCDDMVICTNEQVSYKALVKHNQTLGNNPFRSGEKIDWGSVKRLIVAKDRHKG